MRTAPVFAALALAAVVSAQPVAEGQGAGGALVFTTRRPPRELNGNIRSWANGVRTTSLAEDTQSHVWRVNFMAFLPRPPNSAEVVLSWYHLMPDHTRRYVSNEPIALSDPGERIFFHDSVLHRAAGEFEPMEHYEAVLSVAHAGGTRELARGTIELTGLIERRDGVVDFTGHTPVTH